MPAPCTLSCLLVCHRSYKRRLRQSTDCTRSPPDRLIAPTAAIVKAVATIIANTEVTKRWRLSVWEDAIRARESRVVCRRLSVCFPRSTPGTSALHCNLSNRADRFNRLDTWARFACADLIEFPRSSGRQTICWRSLRRGGLSHYSLQLRGYRGALRDIGASLPLRGTTNY